MFFLKKEIQEHQEYTYAVVFLEEFICLLSFLRFMFEHEPFLFFLLWFGEIYAFFFRFHLK